MNNSLLERNLSLLEAYSPDTFVDELFADIPLSRDISRISMNRAQAKHISTDIELIALVKALLTHGNEERALSAMYEIYEFWAGSGKGPNVAEVLFRFVIGEFPDLESQIDLNEVDAVLAFKLDQRLWVEFLEMGTRSSMVPPFGKSDQVQECLEKLRTSYANYLRRTGRLDEARSIIELQLREWSSAKKPSALILKRTSYPLYEVGYLSYLLNSKSECIDALQKSSHVAFSCGDVVGGCISLCVEFRFRFHWGLCTPEDFTSVLAYAQNIFRRNSAEGCFKYVHARRWVNGCEMHRLEVALFRKDRVLATKCIQAIRKAKHDLPSEVIWWYQEGLYCAALSKHKQAIRWFRKCVDAENDSTNDQKFAAAEERSKNSYYLAQNLEATGQSKKALEYYKRAAEFDDVPGNHTWRARAASAVRRYEEVSQPQKS